MRTPPPDADPSLAAAPRPLPTAEDLASVDVRGFLSRLDANLASISFDSALDTLLPAASKVADGDPRFAAAESLFRGTLRSTLLATSFGDLPPEARVHPDVQRRMWSAMDEIDSALHEMGAALQAITPEERSQITRALRDDPTLGERALAAIEAEAERTGVSEERLRHLREMGQHACFRLRQSTSGFIDEHVEKLQKAKDRELLSAERALALQMGDAAFSAERDWQFAVHEEWQKLLAEERLKLSGTGDDGAGGGIEADDAYAPPAGGAPPPRRLPSTLNPDRGKGVLRAGAWLFGISVMCGFTGAILVQVHNEGVAITGLISFTVAAVLGIAGMICLLVGAILRMLGRRDEKLLAAMNDTL